jgi:ethanolamine-phosphate cytidylyltransferase
MYLLDGCFDIMHSGHYNAIRQAKALTDILVVGVHSNAEILRHKGPPVMSDEERLATVRACKWVDEVVFDTPYNPSLELLIKLNCDFCVHGDDMSTTADGRDAYAEVKEAGRMKIVKRTEGVSTTDLVGRLLLMTRTHHIGQSPALVPTPASGSPLVGALSAKLTPAAGVSPPGFALEPPAVIHSPAVRKSSDVARPPRSPEKPSAAAAAAPAAGGERPISNFLPTTWRITQFSNHRTPSPTDKIVYIDGAFDLFHVGHIETLKQAKALGTFLYVGIHDDSTVNLHKGRNYPIMNLHERVMNVLSCRYVDEVVIGAPWVVTKDLITTLNLHVVCSGTNTKMDKDLEPLVAGTGVGHMADAYAEPKAQGIYQEIETTHTLTTEDVVKKIIKNRDEYEKRNAKRAPKESAYLTGQKTFVAEI